MTLADLYDAFLLDLDGVMYRGDQPIAAAGPTVAALREAGKRIVFMTNNSARTPSYLAKKLSSMGVAAEEKEVLTSALATADMLARESNEKRRAFVIGREGVRSALTEAGIDVVDGDGGSADLVVVGWDYEVSYESLRRATVLVRNGARLIATNSDASYPAPGGELWPGAGAILAAVETASGATATVVGKPHEPLFEAALGLAATRNALVVGDRIETDIVGASRAGIDSVLVRSGAGTLAELVDHEALPVAVLADVGGLLTDRRPARPRPAEAGEMKYVRELTEAPPEASEWGPDGVHVIGDGELEATATVHVRDADAYLRAVETGEKLRGGGLGTIVVAAALRDAAGRGAKRAWLMTETAEPFFAKLGFEMVNRDELPGWIEAGPAEGCPQTAVAMLRTLTG